jgi:hypothetical protein
MSQKTWFLLIVVVSSSHWAFLEVEVVLSLDALGYTEAMRYNIEQPFWMVFLNDDIASDI